MPRVMFMDAGHLINYESHGMSSEAHQTEYETEEQPERYRCATSSSPKEYTSREDEEKVICPLPPPPNHDPQKPLPYRIDFLLNSGVVKHAKMNVNGKQNNSLYFEKKRPRKPRTHFTDIQIEDLEKVFEDKKYLSSHERQIIAHDLCLQEEQVKNWFQNRRSRWRKDCKDYKDAGEELTELVAANKVQDANQDQTAVAVGPNTWAVVSYHCQQWQNIAQGWNDIFLSISRRSLFLLLLCDPNLFWLYTNQGWSWQQLDEIYCM